jgi:Ca-activated chloride channel family protein
LRAEGGTNIADALRDAFDATSPASRLSVVVFMTDGLPSVGEQNPERIATIAERDAGRTRVFAFGVGQDVNTYLLDRLGAAGRGSAQYVQPGESVETALGSLATKIQYPVLTDLMLNATGVTLREVYPTTLPDLFAGEDLVVFGRYRGITTRGGNGVVIINGRRSGKVERYTTRVSFAGRDNGNDYIERLWASRKLGELTRRVRLEGRDRELIAEIRRTALRYGLLSEYTSYFVTEPGMDIPLMAEAGLRNGARDFAATGSANVASAEAARQRREATTLGQVAALEKAAADQAPAAAPPPVAGRATGSIGSGSAAVRTSGVTPRIVAGRAFVQRNGIWESDTGRKTAVVDVVAFSDAYFALLRALPELAPYMELGDIAVGGSSVTIRILDKGVSKLTDAEVAKITMQFRGPPPKP